VSAAVIVLAVLLGVVLGVVLSAARIELATRRRHGERLRDWPRDLRAAAREGSEAARRVIERRL